MDVQKADTESLASQTGKQPELEVNSIEAELIKDWTEEEEKKVIRKIDLIMLPIMGIAFFSLQMDRGNISAALTSTITTDLGINTNQVNVGTQLLSAGIVLLEIPSNIMLQKVGPRNWLSGQVLLWSVVATFQAFIQTYPQYLTTRLLLGFLESGYIPGSLYYLSTWYKSSEASTRTTIFFFGNLVAAATSSLIGAGLLSLDGRNGLAGWRWVWLVEGSIGLGIGILFLLLIPPKVGDGRPFISFNKWSYFTERESYIMKKRVLIDDPLKARGQIKISRKDIMDTIKQPRVWIHVLITLVSQTGTNGLNTYAASIIKGMGHSAVKANELNSVPLFACVVWTFLLSVVCDWSGRRGWVMQFAMTWTVISQGVYKSLADNVSSATRYAALCVTQTSYTTTHVLNVGWITVNSRSPQERSVSLALVIMAANAGGITSAQVFRSDDAPHYHRAMTVELTCVCVAWGIVLLQNILYWVKRAEFPKEGFGHWKERKLRKAAQAQIQAA